MPTNGSSQNSPASAWRYGFGYTLFWFYSYTRETAAKKVQKNEEFFQASKTSQKWVEN